ncbi:uncharacterized protein DUF402 [Mobilisporobacter senegalensis]|uniref:Uncharacterized protein DUF402 n=1 Tax=Mobilisporobacter senegalensis TaxID=1329262 RepID=A0A3N1XG58_9FIRM|nr:DUF402 domain-containing protein [Mobilisporobacter senegalensis]ROR25699.1 uncharacterized protein DUF402 [Mobilisporobacter senegalensis]
MKDKINLYRRRFIPNETIHLKDDKILFLDEDLIITKWNTLKPRKDIARGISAYFLKKGIKVSKIYDEEGNLVYWYCDIIDTIIDLKNHSIIFNDLLADVVIYENGFVKVLDIGEIADAVEQNLIDGPTALKALYTLDTLLDIIYTDRFYTLQKYINDYES